MRIDSKTFALPRARAIKQPAFCARSMLRGVSRGSVLAARQWTDSPDSGGEIGGEPQVVGRRSGGKAAALDADLHNNADLHNDATAHSPRRPYVHAPSGKR